MPDRAASIPVWALTCTKPIPPFRAVFDRVQEEVDFDLKQTCFQDPDGVLNQTRYTSPAWLPLPRELTAVLKEKGFTPFSASGLSLGEYSALHAAGVFDAATAVKLVAFRGKAMEEAAAGHDSANDGRAESG